MSVSLAVIFGLIAYFTHKTNPTLSTVMWTLCVLCTIVTILLFGLGIWLMNVWGP